MNRICSLLLLMLLLCGCAGQKEFCGRYSSKAGWVGVSLDVKKDSTFTYSTTDCTSNAIVDGTWKKEGRFAVLKGENRPIPPNKTTIEESVRGNADSLYVRVTDLTGTDTLAYATIMLWQDTTFLGGTVTNFDGMAVIKRLSGFNNLWASYVFYSAPRYYIKNPKSNYFVIMADRLEPRQIEFKDKKVKFKRNKLSFKNLLPPNKYRLTLYKDKY